MKRIHEIFEDEQIEELEKIKSMACKGRAGYGWRNFIIEAAEAYEEKLSQETTA